MVRWKVVLIAILLVVPSHSRASQFKTEGGEFSYVGYMGGVKIGNATIGVALKTDDYSVKLNMETGGIVGWFVKWTNLSAVFGKMSAENEEIFSPVSYQNQSVWKEKRRLIEIAFEAGKTEVQTAIPDPIKDEGRKSISVTDLKNAIDPLTALIKVGKTIEKTGSCTSILKIFDGRRLFQIEIEDKGSAEVSVTRRAPFGGKAHRCDFVSKQLAGFKPNKEPSEKSGSFYFRQLDDSAGIMPVQIKADSSYGSLIMHLKHFQNLKPEVIKQAKQKSQNTGHVQ